MSELLFKDRRKEERPSSGEAPFTPGEVFYSRTDARGVILGGNYVFRRVSDFEWEELIGAPHKIIRHPDMPRGVFRLMWDRLHAGQPVGAYVKNRARDGLHYWVFAVVAPWQGGYISARIKPTSPLLGEVATLYAELRRAENEDNRAPGDSAGALSAAVRGMGFPRFEDFMTHALCEEILAENAALELPPDREVERAREMLENAQALGQEVAHLVNEFEVLRAVPDNMKVTAARLEPTGGPFSALSRNYGEMSDSLSNWFNSHVLGDDSNFSTISTSVKEAIWLTSFAGVLYRCDRQLRAERRKLGNLSIESERAILLEMSRDYLGRASIASGAVAQEARRILQACTEIRRQLLGLSTVRVACKIEDARDRSRAGSLQTIIDQLGRAQQQIDGSLGRIRRLSGQIAGAAEAAATSQQRDMADELLYGPRMAEALRRESPALRLLARLDQGKRGAAPAAP